MTCLAGRVVVADERPIARRAPWQTSCVHGSPHAPEPYRLVPAFPGIHFTKPTSMAEISAAGRLLVAQVTTVAAKLAGAEVPWPLALAGGVLVHSTLFRARLVEQIQRGGVAIAGMEIVAEPAAGAVRLAAALRRRSIHD